MLSLLRSDSVHKQFGFLYGDKKVLKMRTRKNKLKESAWEVRNKGFEIEY